MKKVNRKSAARRKNTGHIAGLDGLRALAIIGVTLFHMFPNTIRGGYLGVSLFFVISGFLLAVMTEHRYRKKAFRVTSYYLKRIKRIYPPLIIVLVASAGIYFFLERQQLGGIRTELLSIILGYNNWWQIAQNADYFTKITNASPFTHMWFMAIMIQFYLIWPLIFLIYHKLGRSEGPGAGFLFLLVLTVISAVLTPILYRPGMDVTRFYYGTDLRLYALTFGVMLGWLRTHHMQPRLSRTPAWFLAWPLFAGATVITIAAYIRMDGQLPITYRCGMLLMTLLFGGMLVLATDKRAGIGRVLEMQPLRWIGDHSFEIYLWQYPVIFLFMYKKWSGNPVFPILEILIILVLAAWLHWIIPVILRLQIPNKVFRMELWQQIILLAGTLAMILFFITGIIGIATASDTKFAGKDELQKRLEENQKALQDEQNGQSSSAIPTSADSAASSEIPASSSLGVKAETEEPAASKYTYADPDLTNSAVVSKDSVLMIGDSIMLDAAPDLKEELPGCYIDAMQNRQASECVDLAAVLRNEGHVNHTVVISLGTNAPLSRGDIEAILYELGSDVSVFWVNLFGRTVTWENESNQLLRDLSEEYSNLTIINWRDLIIDHPEWLWEDAEHPNYDGSKIFSQLIRESLEVVIDKQNSSN